VQQEICVSVRKVATEKVLRVLLILSLSATKPVLPACHNIHVALTKDKGRKGRGLPNSILLSKVGELCIEKYLLPLPYVHEK
jgi:hypothetical protein